MPLKFHLPTLLPHVSTTVRHGPYHILMSLAFHPTPSILLKSDPLSQSPLTMLHSRERPNPETQIPRYSFKSNQNLNVYREIIRDVSFWIWWIMGGRQICRGIFHIQTPIQYGVATISRLLKNYGSFLQKSPTKEITFCKRDL